MQPERADALVEADEFVPHLAAVKDGDDGQGRGHGDAGADAKQHAAEHDERQGVQEHRHAARSDEERQAEDDELARLYLVREPAVERGHDADGERGQGYDELYRAGGDLGEGHADGVYRGRDRARRDILKPDGEHRERQEEFVHCLGVTRHTSHRFLFFYINRVPSPRCSRR